MTDEIFDYFAGNSPRKVEPLDPNELFDDLLPSPSDPSSESSSTAPVMESSSTAGEEERSPVHSEPFSESNYSSQEPWDEATHPFEPMVESDSGPSDSGPSDSGPSDSGKGHNQELSHWDLLASQLGISVPPVKSPSAPPVSSSSSSSARRSPSKTQDTPVSHFESHSRKRSHQHEKTYNTETHTETSESGICSNVTDLFVPVEEGKRDVDDLSKASSLAAVEEIDMDVDPFAAFHNVPAAAEFVDLIDDDIDLGSDAESDEVPSVTFDEHFVEFEVKNLEHGKLDDSKLGPRRPRRRRRSETPQQESLDSESKSRPATDATLEESQEAELPGQYLVEGQSRSRRRPRRKTKPASSSTNPRTTPPDGQGADTSVRSQPPANAAGDIDHDNDGPDMKRPRIPTWDVAITRIVDGNIRRHKSGSDRKRRR